MEMTAWEICQSYKNAESRSKQIKILAELNVCSKGDIIKILSDNGFNLRIKKTQGAKRKATDKIENKPERRTGHKWTEKETKELIKLYERGYMPYDISEKIGIDPRIISRRIYTLKQKGEIST